MELRNGRFLPRMFSTESVAGAVQMFRRQCFEQIGSYCPLTFGGIDAVAEIRARMHGWDVKTFPEIVVYHHRRVGARANVLRGRCRSGRKEYMMGTHPLFMAAKCANRIREYPYVFGSACMLWGYVSSWLQGASRPLDDEFIRFHRKEQMRRLFRRARK